MTLVKICGIRLADDAAAAVAAGADMIGVIFWAPSPRYASEEQARRVREAVPSGVPLVGVFVDEEPERIDELVESVGLDRVQLHGSESRTLVERYGERAIRGVRDGDLSVVPPGVPVVYDRPWGETRDVEALYAHWRAASGIVRRLARAARGPPRRRTTSRRPWQRCGPTGSTSRAASRARPASRITSACGASSPRPRRRHERGRARARRRSTPRTGSAVSGASAGASSPRR